MSIPQFLIDYIEAFEATEPDFESHYSKEYLNRTSDSLLNYTIQFIYNLLSILRLPAAQFPSGIGKIRTLYYKCNLVRGKSPKTPIDHLAASKKLYLPLHDRSALCDHKTSRTPPLMYGRWATVPFSFHKQTGEHCQQQF